MCLKGIWATGLVLTLLASGCSGEPAPTIPATVSLTHASGLSSKDEIDGLDAMTAPDGTVHVVWRERLNVYGGFGGHNRIVYRRGSGTPLRWGRRVVVADGVSGKPRVVATSDGVHVLAGGRLHHWFLPSGGAAVRDMGELLREQDPVAEAFDAVAIGGAVMVAFVPSGMSDEQTIYGIRWSSAGPGRPSAIETLPRARTAGRIAPALAFLGKRLMLLWAENIFQERYNEKIKMDAVSTGGSVHVAWSDNGGQNWVSSNQVTPMLPSPIAAIAFSGSREAPVVVFADYGLFASRWVNGMWTKPARIARYKPGSFSGSAETTAVAASQCASDVAIAWVDGRYQRSDRRWWNPLGGIPWSDNPDWYNNDAFVALGSLDLGAAGDSNPIQPWRQTPDGSHTREIAFVQRDNELILIRAGRSRVRKSPDDGDASPEVLQSRIACR